MCVCGGSCTLMRDFSGVVMSFSGRAFKCQSFWSSIMIVIIVNGFARVFPSHSVYRKELISSQIPNHSPRTSLFSFTNRTPHTTTKSHNIVYEQTQHQTHTQKLMNVKNYLMAKVNIIIKCTCCMH